jgi:mannosyltransferase OCH1-like enzyme
MMAMSSVETIPRVFHWIWLGSASLPIEHQRWMDGWQETHPLWSHRVWRDADVPALRNQVCFDAARSWAQKADILRYEILLQQGGVYLDTDVECCKSIEPLLEGATAVIGREDSILLGNSVMAATPGHPWVQGLVDGLAQSVAEHRLTMDQTGPAYLTRVSEGRSDVRVLPPATFYPFPSTGPVPQPGQETPPDTYAVHHWAKSWRDGEIIHVRSAAARVLDALISPGASVAVVDAGLGIPLPPGCRRLPFVERDGEDWGPPADDEDALSELARHRAGDTDWLVFLVWSRWWFDYYPALAHALRTSAKEVHEDVWLTAFRLR